MAPKAIRGNLKSKAQAAGGQQSSSVDPEWAMITATATTALKSTDVELRPGELDEVNLAYIEKLEAAWGLIQDHDIFHNIQAASPACITGNVAESGTQAPFDLQCYQDALKTASKSYTAGINLFWINLQWSATPGVPLRVSAIEAMARTTFRAPVSVGTIHVAVPGAEFNPLEHKGALLRVSPEEITGALVLAISRDIQNNEPAEVLQSWKQVILSTTCVFKVLPTATDRYWYALQQRELISMTNSMVHRSTLQGVHEISRLMKRLRETLFPSEVTSAAITKAYVENLQMAPGSPATVSYNFVDCCATVTNKMLDVPGIASCLQDLDKRSAMSEDPNPFDSHSRLQAIIDKCRANNQAQLLWVVQGIWYHWRRGNIKYLSITDIKGTSATGNRGYADLLLFKLQLRGAILGKFKVMFPESADWFSISVSNVAESFRSWFEHEESAEKSWRAGRPPSETKALQFFGEVVFGRAYDGHIKNALKAGKAADDALNMPGMVENLQEIEAKRSLEQQPLGEPTPEKDAVTEKSNPEIDDIVFSVRSKGADEQPTIVKASAIQDGARRDLLDSIINNTRQNIAAQIHLVPQEPDTPYPHGLPAAVMATPLGKLHGSPQPDDPASRSALGSSMTPRWQGRPTTGRCNAARR